jgi:hypothetical protein
MDGIPESLVKNPEILGVKKRKTIKLPDAYIGKKGKI